MLVREHQSERENTVSEVVSERLAWRGHTTVSARVDGRREATLNFAIGAAVAQRRGIIPGACVPLRRVRAAAVAEVGHPPAGRRCGDHRAGGDGRQGAIHLSAAVRGQGIPLPATTSLSLVLSVAAVRLRVGQVQT